MLSDDYEQEQEELWEKLLQLNLTPAVSNDMAKAVYVHAPDKSSGHNYIAV